MAYATIEELERRWRYLTPTESTQAEQLLEDASNILDAWKPTKATDELLSVASCEMVRHAMSARSDAFSLDGEGEQFSAYEPAGDMWLSSATKKALGISALKITSVEVGNEQSES